MKNQNLYVKHLHTFLFFLFLSGIHQLSAQGVIQTVPTFQSIGIYWSASGGSANVVCNVKYRPQGTTTWSDGMPLWFDSRAAGSGTTAARPANEYRGSIVNLTPNTNYEIQLSLEGTSTVLTTNCQTWSEVFPVGTTTVVTNTSAQLNITASGTATAYKLYTPAAGQTATIDANNVADNCIYINASYIIIRGLNLKNAKTDAILLGPNAHDVVIEGCDISGWGRPGVDMEAAVKVNNLRSVTKIIIQRNKMHHPRGNANSWDEGHPYGPQAVGFLTAGGNHVIRYNDIYSDDTHYFNDGIGGGENFSFEGFPRADSDIYGNKISQCWDDAVESEGANCNVRIYGNFMDNTFTGIANAANSIGPMYIWRNVTHVARRHGMDATNAELDVEDRGPFNKCGSQSNTANGGRTYLFHNTVLEPVQPGFSNPRGLDGGVMDNGGGALLNAYSRNNIWQAAYTGEGGRSIAENFNGSGVGCTYDYDLCNTALVLRAGVAGTHIINGAPTYAAGTPTAPLVVNAGARAAGYELTTTSKGFNAGIVLPNFNDGYTGTAPDVGAYEAGKPLLQFGVNAYLPNGNVPPVANAGNDITITLPTNFTTLRGSGTDADGTIASYAWTKTSGPPTYILGAANSDSTPLTGLVQGTYVFLLTVTDNAGATGIDSVRVIVNPAAATNLPPTANAGSDIFVTLPATVTLTGTGADPDGTIAGFSWVKLSGPAGGTLGTPNQNQTPVTALQPGTYTFKLTVTDNLGATGIDSVKVIVSAAPNQPPTANAGGDIMVTLPATVTLVGSGNDVDGSIAGYAWIKVSGPAGGTLGTPNQYQTPVTALQPGTYTFKLTVTDNLGATGIDSVKVIVSAAPNQPPTANAGSDIMVTLPATVTLVGTGSDPDGTIAGYAWVKVSGPAGGTLGTPNQYQTAVTALQPGTYTFKLTVTDNLGATGVDSVRVIVSAAANQPPVANAGNNVSINQPGSTSSLNGNASFDPDGSIASYAWTFISGPATPSMNTPNQVQTQVNGLTAAGTYIFQLTVTDNNGATDEDNVTITVSNVANIPPVADAGNNITMTLPQSSTNVNGGASSDPDGIIDTYAWSYVSGPPGGSYTIAYPDHPATGISGLSQGVYKFKLTVTDNDGASSTDEITITVNAAINQPPVVNAGSDITLTLPNNSTMFDGIAYDPDGTIASTTWSYVSGPAGGTYTIVNPSSIGSGLNNLVQGVYVFKLTVTDNSGAIARDSVKVTVNAAVQPGNQAPVANAGSDVTLTLPQNFTILTGLGYDADGTIASYAWSWVSGPNTYTTNGMNASGLSLSNLGQGVYVFKLTVTDNRGATASDMVTVTVNQSVNLAPSANAGADIMIILPTNTTTLYGSGTDADGTVTYVWAYFSGPANYTIANTISGITGLYNLSQGTYVFRLTVTDNRGATAIDYVTVTVNPPVAAGNQPPVARTENDITITLPTNTTQLHGNTSSDPDGVITSYQWTQLSGPASSSVTGGQSAIATVSNLTTGIYTFELKVTDDDGATATKTIKVTVNNPPNARIFINVYPNPTPGTLNLQYVSNANGKLRILIYDASRKLMKDETIDKTQVSITKTFDVSRWSRGTYFIEVLSSNNKTKATAQFIKM